MPSVTDTTVPCVRTSAPMSRFWIVIWMSSLISDGFNCMDISSAKVKPYFRSVGLPWNRGHEPVDSKSRQFHETCHARSCACIAASFACTEPSITVSPTVTRAPPISSGFDGHRRLDLLAEALLERALQLRQLRVGRAANALSIVALAVASASFFSVSNIAAICGNSVTRSASTSTRMKLRACRVEPVAADRQQQRFLRRGCRAADCRAPRRRARRRRSTPRSAASPTTPASACSSRASSNAASA